MAKMQFFYDYECPFCKKGYEYLSEMIGEYPEIEIEWVPSEAHPRPENVHPHSDLACQGFYIAQELGADMAAFHAALFRAVAIERQNVEDPVILCGILKDMVDVDAFRTVLESGKYAARIAENNDLAYEKSGVWFLPALRMNGKKLDAQGGVGISATELRAFLKS